MHFLSYVVRCILFWTYIWFQDHVFIVEHMCFSVNFSILLYMLENNIISIINKAILEIFLCLFDTIFV